MGIIPLMAFANGDITGKVISKATGEPIDYVTVKLLNATDHKPLPIGAVTGEDGSFIIKGVKDGKYIVKISFFGSVDQEREIEVKGGTINLGTVRLEESQMLKEVVVEGVKSQMRFDLDKKVFSVDANVTAAGASASELLEAIPSVEVDQDGEVSLRGNSSVTIWINGKESGLTADNRAQILEQIPAETIDRIEVITNPSAKYSPEGTAGIINIILKKDRKAGYFGSAELGATSRGGGNASANMNYSSGKIDAYAGLGGRMRHNKGGSIMNREFDDDTFTRSHGESPSHSTGLFMRLGATYHATEKDDISIATFGMMGHNWGHSDTYYSSNVPGNWISNYNYTHNRGDMKVGHAELSYVHKWRENHSLDLTGSFDHWGHNNRNVYLQDIKYPSPDEISESFEESDYQEREMVVRNNTWEVKADYTNQLNEWAKLEGGYNGRFNHENSPISYSTGTTEDDVLFNPSRYNRFIYSNDINAFYATFGGKVKSFSFSAGLRAEAWQVRTRSLGCEGTSSDPVFETKDDVPEYKKNFFSLFPSAFLSWSLPHDNELQINYTRRIRRPWGGQLNSFHDYSDPTNVSYGNPQLEPQYSNSYELNYIKSWTYHMVSLSAYMRTSSNMMNRVSFLDNDIMYSTWANVADERNTGCEIVVKDQFFRNRLDLTTTVNLYDNHISSWTYDFMSDNGNLVPLSGAKQTSFAWDARMMATVRLPWSMSVQATGSYNSKRLTAQGSRQGGWGVDLGIRKNLGSWSFALNCRDLFDSRRWKSTTNGPGYTQYNERWRGGRTVRLTIKYSFGNMKKNNNGPEDRGDEGSNDFGGDMGGEM